MGIVALKLVHVLLALLLLVRREGLQVVGLVADFGHDEEAAFIVRRSRAGSIHRSDFPKDMVFGVSSSAYQYEGAVREGGRGPSVWDTTAYVPGHTSDNSTGDLGVDQYHRYKEDVELMKDLQVDAYRFSISWSRLFPDGFGLEVNQEGVDYYNSLINELVANGIQPCVTLWHWDLPQGLQDAFGGWNDPAIIPVFAHYAETCFREFGDRVKTWITMNEPHEFLLDHGTLGCKDYTHSCGYENLKDAPYMMAHNVILSHTAAYQVYQSKYKSQQGGCVGTTVDAQWYESFSNSTENREAAERMKLFAFGWFLDPFFFGDYPEVMKIWLGKRLPKFTEEESENVKGSLDFVGINHYTSMYAVDQPSGSTQFYGNYFTDPRIIPILSQELREELEGVLIFLKSDFSVNIVMNIQTAISWLYVVPWGIEKVLHWVKMRYDNPPVIITENGVAERNDPTLSLEKTLNDQHRINYLSTYLAHVQNAVRAGSNLKGYFVWSLLDNFEWNAGYSLRFGLHHVDYFNDFRRIPKKSASWYNDFLRQSAIYQR